MAIPSEPSPIRARPPSGPRPRRWATAAVFGTILLAAAACSSPPPPDAHASPGGATTAAAPAQPARAERVDTEQALYDAPDPIPAGRHGTLVRYQEITPSLVNGARTYRIMYLSESLNKGPIVVTGTALVPDSAAPEGGRVVLTIAHGTTGVADQCAPSKNPGKSELGLMSAPVQVGWLVVQTDYEGLGTPGRHPYLVGESEGRSVIDAVLAAGSLPGASTPTKVAIAGYSQGGHGALWAHQVAPTWAPDLDVVGTFAGAPATEMDLIIRSMPIMPVAGFGMMIAAGYAAAYPDADPSKYLTEKGLAKLDAVDSGCAADVFKAIAGIPSNELIRPDGAGNPPWSTLGAANNPGQAATRDPVLIIHSDQDETVPVGLSAMLHDRMCSVGQVVERRVLAGGGTHVKAAVPAYTAGLAWLTGRLAGTPPVNDCAPGPPPGPQPGTN